MNGQALRMAVAGGLLIASALAAEPLQELRGRLLAARSEQPIRVTVEVELAHKEKAGRLHREGFKRRGRVVVDASLKGVHLWEQVWRSTTSGSSFWGDPKTAPGPLLAEADARALVDPAEWLGILLVGSTVVDDQTSTWEGKPARLLVLRSPSLTAELEAGKTSKGGEPPVADEMKIWLGADGLPLALERTALLRLADMETTQRQTLTFQQSNGRLLVAQSTETSSGTGPSATQGSDTKTMKVTVD
ncbi:MAG TPA: hypothetical protein VIJ36_19930 [Thermoanaerobaculia bacterium]